MADLRVLISNTEKLMHGVAALQADIAAFHANSGHQFDKSRAGLAAASFTLGNTYASLSQFRDSLRRLNDRENG